MNRADMFKKGMSILLAFALLIACAPGIVLNAYAAAGPDDGQVEYVGGTQKSTVGEITVSKTIEAVEGKENYFDITLQASVGKYQGEISTDVVIVLDISNTMNSAPVSGSGTKLDQAKAAANQFIKQYAQATDLPQDRRIGVVTFNQNAQVAVALQEANDLSDYETNFEGLVSAITAPKTPVEIKFTNIEGGLQLAGNILAQSDAEHKFVILLTDGFPTTYIESDRASTTKIYGYDTYMSHTTGYSSYNASWMGKNADGTLVKPGYLANSSLGKTCQYGADYSDYGAQRAQAVAQEMRTAGVNIFSVGIDIGEMTIAEYLDIHKGNPFTTVDTNGMGATYAIGSDSDTDAYKAWLGNSIAGGPLLSATDSVRYSSGDSATELAAAYSNILNTIRTAQETALYQLYTYDPMSDEADFVGFYDKDGKLSTEPDKLTGTSELNGENTAVYGNTGNADRIYWDMLNSGYTMDGEKRVFTLKYRVRLKNEQDGFDFAVGYEMNNKGQSTAGMGDDEKAALYYSHKFVVGGEIVDDGTGSVEYPAPKTEGYEGSLRFCKVDGKTNEAMSGVAFTLKHLGQSCSVCGGDAAIEDMKAESDANGYVLFEHIPSGHEYTLSETEPEGYLPAGEQAVIVSYADTYIGTKTAENKLVDGVFPAKAQAYIITNMKVHTHVWTYSVEGTTVIATCEGPDGICPIGEKRVTLIPPADSTYTGEINGTASVEGGIEGHTPVIRYTGTDYDSQEAPVNAGTYTVTMQVCGKTVSAQFTINPKNIESCTVSLDESAFIYSGEAPELDVSCADSSVDTPTLEKNTDYTVGQVTGVDAGTHSLTVTGTGNYTGTVELEYKIDPKPITVTDAVIADVSYNPDGYTLTVTGVTFDGVVEGQTLVLNTDYTATAELTGPNAVGDEVAAAVTVTLSNGNYTLSNDQIADSVKIVKAATPATGDDFNIMLCSAMLVVSFAALMVLLLVSMKRRQVK